MRKCGGWRNKNKGRGEGMTGVLAAARAGVLVREKKEGRCSAAQTATDLKFSEVPSSQTLVSGPKNVWDLAARDAASSACCTTTVR